MFKTIRSKILAVTIASLLSASTIGLVYIWGIMSISRMLFVTQHFEDLLNNILEVRRYEKNFLLYGNPNNLVESLYYLNAAQKTIEELSDDIELILGKEKFNLFVNALEEYVTLVHKAQQKESGISPEKLRNIGKKLVEYANKLVELKRKLIHKTFKRTAALPFIFLGVFVIVAVLIVNLVFKKLLKPLKLIEETTERVGHGDFSPIPGEWKGEDEITRLIRAFNSMAHELEVNQEALIQSRKIAALGTFTAGIAHELNNPLNNVCLTADALIEEYGDELSPGVRELIFDIIQQAERAADIVKNLLDFSRTERLTLSCLNLKDVVNKTYKLVKNQLMLAGIKFEANIPENLPPVLGHFRSLQQVFLNLFLNAIQAIEHNGKITVTALEDSNKYIRVDVTDTGKGIKPEDLNHIFTPFYTTKGTGRGTGLGLSVTYSLIKKHGGHIEVQSELGKGTTFSVYLQKCNMEESNGDKTHSNS